MNLPLPVALGIWIALGVAVLALIIRGLLKRRNDGAEIIHELDEFPTAGQQGKLLCGPYPATYISTTQHGDWLARVGVFGLGNRSSATIEVYEAGVLIRRAGECDLFIPQQRLSSWQTASGIAGKYIPHDGIDVITWQPHSSSTLVDTGIRITNKTDRSTVQHTVESIISSHALTLEENS